MRARVASLSFFLASVGAAVTWLTLLPSMVRLLDALRRAVPPESPEARLMTHVRAALPFYLAADVLVLVVICSVILYFALARPLQQTEAAVEQLGNLRLDLPISPGGGPLLSRIQASLRRMAGALAEEQALTRKQLQDLRAANERLTRAQAELVASERLATVGRLAAGVAHEVGNPLSGILGYLSLLRMQSEQSGAGAEYVDRIEGEVQRIDRIVRGLLDLGRPPQVALSPVELAPLVRNCVQLVRAGPELRQVKVEVAIPDGVVATVDPGPLSQVVINLLINAGQAMGGQGELRLHAAEPDGARVRLLVDDTGPGLSPEVQARLFEPFFTTKEAGKGTGLGLAVSLHLLTTMGGTLTATNRPEGGARFTIELPAASVT